MAKALDTEKKYFHPRKLSMLSAIPNEKKFAFVMVWVVVHSDGISMLWSSMKKLKLLVVHLEMVLDLLNKLYQFPGDRAQTHNVTVIRRSCNNISLGFWTKQ